MRIENFKKLSIYDESNPSVASDNTNTVSKADMNMSDSEFLEYKKTFSVFDDIWAEEEVTNQDRNKLAMNWIKITPETELPEDNQLCLIKSGGHFIGGYDNTQKVWYVIDSIWALHDVTHFAIITNPEE